MSTDPDRYKRHPPRERTLHSYPHIGTTAARMQHPRPWPKRFFDPRQLMTPNIVLAQEAGTGEGSTCSPDLPGSASSE